MTKSYDSIIGDLIWNLGELREFVEENEIPSFYIDQVREIQERLETLDYYMAYGEEPEPLMTRGVIVGVDFTDSLEILETL
jgi:hypothetical protein